MLDGSRHRCVRARIARLPISHLILQIGSSSFRTRALRGRLSRAWKPTRETPSASHDHAVDQIPGASRRNRTPSSKHWPKKEEAGFSLSAPEALRQIAP